MEEELEYKGVDVKRVWEEESKDGMNVALEIREIWAPHYPKSKEDFVYKSLSKV